MRERERARGEREREREHENAACLEHAHALTRAAAARREDERRRCPSDGKVAEKSAAKQTLPCRDTAAAEARKPPGREKMPGHPFEKPHCQCTFLKTRLACTPRALSRVCVRARVRFAWEKRRKQQPGQFWAISGNKFFSPNKAWARPGFLPFSWKTQVFWRFWPELGPKTHGRGIEGCPF